MEIRKHLNEAIAIPVFVLCLVFADSGLGHLPESSTPDFKNN